MIQIQNVLRRSMPALVLVVLGVLLAGARGSGSAGLLQDPDADTELAGIMLKMRSAMKELRRELEAKDPAAGWKTVCTIQQHILEAKLESPDMAQSKPDAQRAAFVDAYREQVSGLLKRSCDLEAAVLSGKLDEAGEVLGEMMGPMQKAGHKKFRSD